MSYVGNVPTTAAFPFDQFSGNGSTTAFTLSYAPAGSTSIIVSISGVVQNPNTYSVSGTTLTFTPAPPSGTSNIAVLYLGLPVVATLTPGNTAYFSSSVFTATASQTVFTPSGTYQAGFINVIRNGSQLAPADYTATNGTTVTLANPCTAGDTVVIEVFNLVSIANALPATGGTVTGATTFNSTVQVNGANVSGFTGFKNRIINPGMVIDQRNNGASVALTASNVYNLDRWYARAATGSGHTAIRSTTAPTGFINSLLITIGTGASPGATDNNYVAQRIEGLNVSDLGWGTANAATVTLSFVVRSSVTGTFGGAVQNSDLTRSYPFTYTISAANTFETKTVTIPGDTTGTWLTTNGIGATLTFDLGTGSTFQGTAGAWAAADFRAASGTTKLVATSGATFYITGVQLERGSNATSFEFRDYGRELILCQRYYQEWGGNSGNERLATGFNYSTTQMRIDIPLVVTMRSTPTLTVSAASDWAVEGPIVQTCTSINLDQASTKIAATNFNVVSGLTSGQGGHIMANGTTNARFRLSSEL